ncbi:MAG: phosphate/phosphite/phosphonate ABC transporter substrate-binding protein [Gemmobacter sp.]|jgi:ABC-type phosphate/phosphonate transport system substrate-binding protein|nr:phosphate/phosphite/phosphonate ABC transporter substrate-binding protein [Gemmobacter sp.]
MIATLGMYDRPETQGATDRFWVLIRDGLRAAGHAAPEHLSRDTRAYMENWLSPDLLLSQTCGYPFRARLHPKVTLIGTPDYGVEGCPPGHYRSVLVCRASDPRDSEAEFATTRLAFNEDLSQSGWAAPALHMAERGLPTRPALRSGAHLASARAVAEGAADWAALDAVTWRLILRHDPFAARLRVWGQTAPAPGLPYITAAGRDPAPIRRAIRAAIAALAPQDRDAIGPRKLVEIPAAIYLAQPNPPPPILAEA